MSRKSIFKKSAILLFLWLVPFLYCISVVFYWKAWTPDNFPMLFSEVVYTFSPQIAIITGFLFSDRFFGENKRFLNPHYLLAMSLSVIYISIFVIIIIEFHTDRLKATDVISTFQLLRASLSFLIAGVLIFLFTSRDKED